MSHVHLHFINDCNQYQNYLNVKTNQRQKFKTIVLICAIGVVQHFNVVVARKDAFNISSSYVPLFVKTADETSRTLKEPSEPSIVFHHNNQEYDREQRNSALSSTSESEYLASPITDLKTVVTKNSTIDIFFADSSPGNNGQSTKPESTTHSHFSVKTLVPEIDGRLRSIRNVELGITKIQEMFDAMDFLATTKSELNETLHTFCKHLSEKLQKATTDIFHLKTFFETNITHIIGNHNNKEYESSETQSSPNNSTIVLNTVIQPCTMQNLNLEKNYNKHQIQILNYLNNNNHSLSLTLNGMILEEIQRLHSNSNNYKNVYFLSNNDYASDHNCQYYFSSLDFRRIYVSTIMQKKRLFILIDSGNALSAEQMQYSKTFISNIIHLLESTDLVTVVQISDEPIPLKLFDIQQTTFAYRATADNKEKILDYLSTIKSSTEPTNHSLGFEYSFRLLKEQNISKNEMFEFIYVTRGLLTRLSDAKSVLAVIALGQEKLTFPVVINTCAIILDKKRIMYEKQFLNDITYQNYSKYGINVSSWYPLHLPRNLAGNLYVITKRYPEHVIKISTEVFFDLFHRYNCTSNNKLQLHQPYLNYDTKDMVVPMTYPIGKFGVVGVNLYLSDLAEDVMGFQNTANCYMFLMDVKGTAIIHPALQQVPYLIRTPLPVDIALLENSMHFRKFHDIRTHLVTLNSGNITVDIIDGIKASGRYSKESTSKTYSWRRVLDMFVICIVTIPSRKNNNVKTPVPQYQSRDPNVECQHFQHREYLTPIDLLYHRIDLISPPRTPVCRYFRQIATLDSGTLFLSSSSFKSPFTYNQNNRMNCDRTTTRIMQSIMAYIKDDTCLLVNPGLLPRIRNDVNILYKVMEYLKQRHLENGELKSYIIRRYAATISGVLQVYPGCMLASDFDPLRRPWFLKAMQYPGKIILTKPYLDVGGAGYVITIAHTIFEGKANALHNPARDSAVAIIALDVPYGFFYKLILDKPLCQEDDIKCILFDDKGYLIAHPSMIEPVSDNNNLRRPHEHLTYKESFLSNDILNHKTLVAKKACANYENRTVQRYYQFNTSLTEILTNVVHGERTKYKVTAVFGTNIFVAVLNSTCNGGAFCPCSTVDRVCLNCNRMDQTDCECPCECPMHMNTPSVIDDTEEYTYFESYSLCYPYCEQLPLSDIQFNILIPSESSNSSTKNLDFLNSCVHINCDSYYAHIDCLAVMGCEWCQLDLDGSPLNVPFCTMQSSCFNGVLNSKTPYGEGELMSAIIEPPNRSQPFSLFGPAGGAIIVLFLIIGFAMYCYRQSLDNGINQFCVDSLHDENYGVPLSRFNFDNIPSPDNGHMNEGHRGVMNRNLAHPLSNAIAVPDPSPYHMSTGSSYRRPPNGESDHGYSTMTPHEDSEHMCFTLAEPLINNNKRLSKSDTLSITTSVSSPTNHNNCMANVERPVSCMGIRIRSAIDEPIIDTPKNISMLGKTDLSACCRESGNHQQQQTTPHHVLARVTVHRQMEAL